jgi:hypothetical protein
MPFDIHIEGVPRDELLNEKFITFGKYPSPLAVKGIQKLVDRFLKCLITPAGTDISDPNYGTQLVSLFLGNFDAPSMRQMIRLAVINAEDQIRRYDVINGAPEDERLASATIESLNLDESAPGFELTVLLQNTAGTTVLVLLPTTVTE